MTTEHSDKLESSLPKSRGELGLVSAIICTANRGDSIAMTLRSLQASDHQDFEVLVIDQSKNDDTRRAVEAIDDSRIRYIRSDTPGTGRARTQGLIEAKSDYCCFTDDDCEVAPDWLSVMAGLLRANPKVAVVFSSVLAADYDRKAGFIPAYEPKHEVVIAKIADKCRARGIGASMAVRKSIALGIGGFDCCLGPGSRFFCCEEGDLSCRSLLAGFQLIETNRTSVLHYGFRTWEQGKKLSQRDWFGIGAAYSKPLKAGRWEFAPVPSFEFWNQAVGPIFKDIFRLRKPSGLTRPIYFIKGFLTGIRQPVDRKTLLFAMDQLGLPYATGLAQAK